MRDYVIAIPSYGRHIELTQKTLPTLDKLKADRDKIHIFVANEEEAERYKEATQNNYRIVVGVKGLPRQRQFYFNWFPENTRIVSLDDDVEDVFQKQGNKSIPLTYTLDELADEGYAYCEQFGARLWGLNHMTNPFYMKDEIWVGLRYCPVTFHGSYSHEWIFTDPNRRYATTGEDHYNSLRSFSRYGANIRFEYISFKQDWLASGGIAQCVQEEDQMERREKHRQELLWVNSQYPELSKIIYHEDTGITALRLKPITLTKLPRVRY